LLSVICIFIACEDDAPMQIDKDCFQYTQTPYEIISPPGFPPMPIPEDNPMTEEGIRLGRMLFWDPILSSDSTLACAGCHAPNAAFSENLPVSVGTEGIAGTRNSMPLFNLGWLPEFTWDGRALSLEEQILEPVPNPIEMNLEWEIAAERLNTHPDYPDLFNRAFNICEDIDSTYVSKAIAQFLRTMISAGSKYDQAVYGDGSVQLTDEELNGFDIFQSDTDDDGHCQHCHGSILFSTIDDYFRNNGLEDIIDISQYDDPGLGGVTGNTEDIGKFKAATLRNIELTAPYMHDGRFATLDETIDHYISGGHQPPNVDIIMQTDFTGGLTFGQAGKEDLIAFLKTLTDWEFVNDTSFQSPF